MSLQGSDRGMKAVLMEHFITSLESIEDVKLYTIEGDSTVYVEGHDGDYVSVTFKYKSKTKTCDHKFVDSNVCLKCGFRPAASNPRWSLEDDG